MGDAGLPNGVIFDDGGPINKQRYVQFAGGSNAQSSIIQFFDLVLSVEHKATGEKKDDSSGQDVKKHAKAKPSFIHEMRKYMPGPHARFLERVGEVANIREFVQQHRYDRELTIAYDACISMLSALRDKHIQMVSRYIIIKSRQAKNDAELDENRGTKKMNLALAHRSKATSDGKTESARKTLTGTGGSSLVSFLRQARDETGEPALDIWTRRLLNKQRRGTQAGGKDGEDIPCQGLAGMWTIDENSGGLCSY